MTKVFPSNSSFIHITMLIHRYYFYKNKRKVHHNTLKILTHILFWIQWCQTTKIMVTERGVLDKFQSLISQKRKLTWNFKLQKPIGGYKYELLWVWYRSFLTSRSWSLIYSTHFIWILWVAFLNSRVALLNSREFFEHTIK